MATAMALDLNPKATWMADAHDAISALASRSARTGADFTADDLRRIIGEPGHANWVGSAFSSARRLKLIEPTGYTLSRTRSRHHGVIRTWKGVGA